MDKRIDDFLTHHGVKGMKWGRRKNTEIRKEYESRVAKESSVSTRSLKGGNDMSSDVDDFLSHHGVKGMKWGVRRKHDGSSWASGGRASSVRGSVDSEASVRDSSGRLSLKNPKVRRAAIIGASVVAIGAAAYVASRYSDKPVDPAVIKKGAEKASKILKEPTDIIYMSKPYKGAGVKNGFGVENTSLRFITKGQTEDFFTIFDKAGLNSEGFKMNSMRKMSNGDVATLFSDLSGRRDAAGRKIPHAVLIPASKAIGLDTFEDVITKYGPELEKRYTDHLIEERKKKP